MIIDSYDIDHLVAQIKPEVNYLSNQFDLIYDKLKRQFKKKGVHFESFLEKNYKSPKGTINWKLLIYVPIQEKYQKISVHPIAEVENKGKKAYVHFNLQSRITNSHGQIIEPYILVYSAHYLSRFKERAAFAELSTFEVFKKIYIENRVANSAFWDAQENEYRMLNNWGMSIGRYITKYGVMYFDTFIDKSLLKPDQEKWIFDLIDKVIVRNDLELNHNLFEYWKEYFSPNAINVYAKQDVENMIKTKRFSLK